MSKLIEKKLVPLSASRIKTFENCSWLYWGTYHLKLPQISNDGAKKGDICHRVFECLLNPRHLKNYKKIVKKNSISACPSTRRMIEILVKKCGLPFNVEVITQLDNMIMVGLHNDFFVKDGKLVAPEYKFDILSEQPEYRIKGFIDKPFIKEGNIIIDDFKSSKKKFQGEEQHSNIQALMYSLATKKIWPNLKPIVRFIFLQFPESPIQKVQYSDNTLKGFEEYLGFLQQKVNLFSEKDAVKGFAADKPTPKNEFKGKLMCGFASQPNQLKKDGTKMWHCPYKFPFDYYVIIRNDEIISSALTEKELKLKDGDKVEKKKYTGCPAFNRNILNNFEMPIVEKESISTLDVLDDF